jgi:hypothetical protein
VDGGRNADPVGRFTDDVVAGDGGKLKVAGAELLDMAPLKKSRGAKFSV